jgi:hypothetical protein
MKLFHPSRQSLSMWAENGRGLWVDRHVHRCDRCSTALEGITELHPSVLRGLLVALAPPTETKQKINIGLLEAGLREETLGLICELFGVGWITIATMLEEEQHDR